MVKTEGVSFTTAFPSAHEFEPAEMLKADSLPTPRRAESADDKDVMHGGMASSMDNGMANGMIDRASRMASSMASGDMGDEAYDNMRATQQFDMDGTASGMTGGMYGGVQFQKLQQQMQAQQMQGSQMQGKLMQGQQLTGDQMQGYQMQRQHMEIQEAESQEMEGQDAEGQQSFGFDEELPMSTATMNKLNQINHIMRALHTVQRLKQSLVSQQNEPPGQYHALDLDGHLDAAGFEGQTLVDMDGTQIPRESWMLPSEKTLMKRESWLQDPAVDGGMPDGLPQLPQGATGPMMPMIMMNQQATLDGGIDILPQGSLPITVSAANNFRQRMNVKRGRMNAKRMKDDEEEEEDPDGDADGAAKRRRRKKSAQQMCMLREVFGVNPKPTKMCIRVIAQNTHLTYQEVSRWFRNERHKSKKGSVPRGGGASARGSKANAAAGPADDDNEGDVDGDTWENEDDDGDEHNSGWV